MFDDDDNSGGGEACMVARGCAIALDGVGEMSEGDTLSSSECGMGLGTRVYDGCCRTSRT